MEVYRVAFFGHRELQNISFIEDQIERLVLNLLRKKEFVEFYVGRNGDFDIAVASAIKRAQRRFGKESSSLILVLPYHMRDEIYYEEFYDEILYPLDDKSYYKSAITKRNRWMVEHVDWVVAYILHSYGGAYQAYSYAKKRQVEATNLRLSDTPF